MNPYDQKFLQITLESMKLAQGGLQQLMTLSAGALALYFGFIGKAPFADAVHILGVFVVMSWISALCTAAIAHLLHAQLFRCLCSLSTAIDRVLMLESIQVEFQKDVAVAIDQVAVAKAALRKLEEGRKKFEIESLAFEATFFPRQDWVARLTTFSLTVFVLGFVILGAYYFVWSFNT